MASAEAEAIMGMTGHFVERARDMDALRNRLEAVKDQVASARDATWRPFNLRLSALLAAMFPLGVACALIRLAAVHNVIGFGLTLAIGAAVSGAGLIVFVWAYPEEKDLAGFFLAEFISLAVVATPISFYFLGR